MSWPLIGVAFSLLFLLDISVTIVSSVSSLLSIVGCIIYDDNDDDNDDDDNDDDDSDNDSDNNDDDDDTLSISKTSFDDGNGFKRRPSSISGWT